MTPIERAREISKAETLLGVRAHASQDEIRLAWRRLAFSSHPDHGSVSGIDMADVNAAYQLLKTRRTSALADAEPAEAAPAAPVRPGVTPTRLRPRPSVTVRMDRLTEAERQACAAALDAVQDVDTERHIPSAIQRRGRAVDYVVTSKLACGRNAVAVPTGDFIDARRVATRVISINASTGGGGVFTVPDAVRERAFPGAREVRIVFGAATV